MSTYDFLIVGSGLYGSVMAYKAKKKGFRCLVIEKRAHLGGNVYCEDIDHIQVHKYGAHIFHTSNPEVWSFVTKLVEFNHYINSPIANYHGRLFNLPFNMNTFYQLWGTKTPEEARNVIEQQRIESGIQKPNNLEEQAISLIGKDLYQILIKEYTEKQWGRPCTALPASIINRIPVRFSFNNNYFSDKYQGIPIGVYNKLIDRLLDGIETRCNTDFFQNRQHFESIANKIIYTGCIDSYFNDCYGKLDYRSLRFETEQLDKSDYQGNAVINYTGRDVPFTRIIEHKHFEFGEQPNTVITKEYPLEGNGSVEPFYPINDDKNNRLFEKYNALAHNEKNTIFGGRLAEYRYYDMDKVIEKGLYEEI